MNELESAYVLYIHDIGCIQPHSADLILMLAYTLTRKKNKKKKKKKTKKKKKKPPIFQWEIILLLKNLFEFIIERSVD